MTKRRVGVVGLLILRMALGVWVLLPKHRSPLNAGPTVPVAASPAIKAAVLPAFATKTVAVSRLCGRPSPQDAARNGRRYGFAWILRQLGASEDQLDRLADLRFAEVLTELKQKAQAGDAASINILGEIAQWNCRRGRDEA